ncbi:MAG: carbonic anhydrase [Planctomycetota bacterium]
MSFCTAINCMDGRVQLPVIAFLKEYFKVEYVDTITEAGPVRVFDKTSDLAMLNSLYSRVDISVDRHASKGLAVCAHSDCAGNPIDDDQQKQQLQRAVIFLREKYPNIEIIGLWVDQEHHVHKCT